MSVHSTAAATAAATAVGEVVDRLCEENQRLERGVLDIARRLDSVRKDGRLLEGVRDRLYDIVAELRDLALD